MPDITPIAPIRDFLEAATVLESALSLTTILQGAEADPTKIGAEYLPDNISAPTLGSLLTTIGIPTYANLTDANTALGIGKPYYDTALLTLNITTA